MSILNIKLIPENWLREIEAGTTFGKKAESAWATMQASVGTKPEKKEQPPDVSAFGTKLRAAVEKEIGKPQSCGQCIGYMRSLNQQAEHDTKAIAQYLFANFGWPHEWREKYSDHAAMKKRITEIVESVEGETNDRIN